MKSKKASFKFIIPLVLLVVFPFMVKSAVLLDVKSLKVSKNYPAEFLFDFTENDNVILSFNKVGGNIESSKLIVDIIDLNDIEESVIESFRIPSGNFRVPSDGKYLIRIEYTGKDITLKGRQFANISLKVESLDTETLSPGEFRNVMQLSSIAIDDDEENALKVVFKVKKGDVINFSSADSKASLVKVNLQQLGKTGFVNSLTGIPIPQDNYLTCNIFLSDNSEAGGLLDVRELLKNGDLLFSDLVISMQRPAKPLSSSNPEGNSSDSYGSGTSNSIDDTENTTSDPYAEYLQNLQEQQSSGSNNSMAIAAALQNSQDMSKETIESMLEFIKESSKPKEYVDVVTIPQADISLELGPADNLFKKNKNSAAVNRDCRELVLRGTNYNQWFYWVAVGEKAGEAFEEELEKSSAGRRKSIIEAKGEYIFYRNDPTNQRFNQPFPNLRNYPSYFTEDVEYAIVDDVNREKFLNGERFNKVNLSGPNRYVTVEENYALSPPNNDIIYHACFCNNNKRTPIKVIFKYFTIDTETSSR